MSDITRDRLISDLRGFAVAYPEDIFTPLTPEEIEEHPLIITKASASMGRHFQQWFTAAADMLSDNANVASAAYLECAKLCEIASNIGPGAKIDKRIKALEVKMRELAEGKV